MTSSSTHVTQAFSTDISEMEHVTRSEFEKAQAICSRIFGTQNYKTPSSFPHLLTFFIHETIDLLSRWNLFNFFFREEKPSHCTFVSAKHLIDVYNWFRKKVVILASKLNYHTYHTSSHKWRSLSGYRWLYSLCLALWQLLRSPQIHAAWIATKEITGLDQFPSKLTHSWETKELINLTTLFFLFAI